MSGVLVPTHRYLVQRRALVTNPTSQPTLFQSNLAQYQVNVDTETLPCLDVSGDWRVVCETTAARVRCLDSDLTPDNLFEYRIQV